MNFEQQQIKQFFDSWGLYKKFLQYNYMNHQELFAATHKLLLARTEKPLRFLDIGCGDAIYVINLLQEFDQVNYTGIDLSTTALQEAQQNFSHSKHTPELIAGDLVEVITELDSHSFDVILSSFCLHHYQLADKHNIYRQIHQLLKPGGSFIMIDLWRQDNHQRSDYLSQTMNQFYEELIEFTPEEIAYTKQHIESADFPDTLDETRRTLVASGFEHIIVPYQIKHFALFHSNR